MNEQITMHTLTPSLRQNLTEHLVATTTLLKQGSTYYAYHCTHNKGNA